MNRQVRAPKVRVVTDDGSMLGVMTSRDAFMEAQNRGLDLVEISPNANPPVCKLMDYGKYKYELKKKAQGQKKQPSNVIKELTLSPVTQTHDLQTKVKKAIDFLEEGNRVKFSIRFRGRQMAHPEVGHAQLKKIETALQDLAQIEVPAKMEGRQLACLFAPLPSLLKKKADEAAKAAKEAKKSAKAEKPSKTEAPAEATKKASK